MPTDQDLRRALIDYRETVIQAEHPGCSREHGVLRRAMIDHLVAWKPTSGVEWIVEMPDRLLANTDSKQLARHAPMILGIVQRHLRHTSHLRLVG